MVCVAKVMSVLVSNICIFRLIGFQIDLKKGHVEQDGRVKLYPQKRYQPKCSTFWTCLDISHHAESS